MILKTIIIDDEEFAREELKHQLSIYPDFEIVSEAVNGTDAIQKVKDLKPDLIFMDIEMPGLKGIEVAEMLFNDSAYNPFIVIVTAYHNFAIDAFKYDVKDYLLKPIEPKRFSLTISKVLKHFESKNVFDSIVARSSNKSTIIKTNEISFITVENSVIFIYLADKPYSTTFRTLDEIEKILDPNIFVRTHRGYIVNIKKVREVKQLNSGNLSLKITDNDAKEIPVSRTKVKDIKCLLKL